MRNLEITGLGSQKFFNRIGLSWDVGSLEC